MTDEMIFSVRLSLTVATLSTLIVSLSATSLGYLLARKNFPLKNLLDAFCTLPLVLPPTVLGYYLLALFGKDSALGRFCLEQFSWSPVFSWEAAVMAAILVSFPLMLKTSRAAFESVDTSYELVSLSLGKSKLETMLKITVPLALPGLLAGLALSFTRGLGEFGATLMFAGNIPGKTQTLPLLIYQAVQGGETQLVSLLVILLSLFSLLVLFAINKWGARIW